MSIRWAEYDRWNQALHDLVYGGESAHQPVYLDVEDDLLASAAARLGLDLNPSQAEEALAMAVRQTLMLGHEHAGLGVLSGHRRRLDTWRWTKRTSRDGRVSAPPVIALLAVFARAAELMGRDAEFTSRAYFPRLHRLLAVSAEDEGRVASAFRHDSERFWRALNDWLDSYGGSLGEATAEAIGHRYVGIPMSQALMRKADRQFLLDFFYDHEFEPGLRLSTKDMTDALKPWLAAGNGSASLRSIWRSAAGRKILVDAAIQALAQWDGNPPWTDDSPQRIRPPMITARVTRSGLGRSRLDIGFAIRGNIAGKHSIGATWEILSSPGQPKPLVELGQLTEKVAAPTSLGDVEAASLVTGQLRMRSLAVPGAPGLEISRKPQPIVVLAYLEEAGLHVEVEHARLGESHLVLVNSGATKPNGEPRFDLGSLLADIAQPGFARVDGLAGVPAGWSLYRDVVVLARHDLSDMALDVLRPSQSSVLTVSGGLRMPGQTQRWSARVPVTIRAVSDGADSVNVKLLLVDDDGVEQTITAWTDVGSEVVVSTAGSLLEPGYYRVELRTDEEEEGSDPRTVTSFGLCTGAEPRLQMDLGRLRYWPGGPPFPHGGVPGELAATRQHVDTSVSMDHGRQWVEGAFVGIPSSPGPDSLTVPGPVWWKMDQHATTLTVLAEPAPPDSCAVTGMHREHIETHVAGKMDRGVCSGCGRVKMYRSTPHSGKKGPRPEAVPRPLLKRLGEVSSGSTITGADLLDAIVWLGEGTTSELSHLVRQVDDSALTVDEVRRLLESLGHIDVSRLPASLAVDAWAISPRCLAQTEQDDWVLVGNWDTDSIDAVASLTVELGGSFIVEYSDWIPTRVVRALPFENVESLAQAAGAAFAPDAGRRLLDTLRPITEVGADLIRVSAEGIFNAEWFNTGTAAWTGVEALSQPGAYRLRQGFVTTYILRDATDVEQSTAARVTPQLAKHAAAHGRPLVAYDSGQRLLFVPLGADLPGLYGRALTLMSGRPPTRVQGKPLLAYRSVPADAAATLLRLLKD